MTYYIFAQDMDPPAVRPRPFYWATMNPRNPLALPMPVRWSPEDANYVLTDSNNIWTLYISPKGNELKIGDEVVGVTGYDGVYVRTEGNDRKLDNLSRLPTKAEFDAKMRSLALMVSPRY